MATPKTAPTTPPAKTDKPNGADPSIRITGAEPGKVAEAAATELETSRGKTGRPSKYMNEKKEKEEAEARAARRAANLELGKDLALAEAGIVSAFTGEPRYYAFMEKMDRLQLKIAESYANVSEAYGFEMTGKITSIISVAMAHGQVALALHNAVQEDNQRMERGLSGGTSGQS